MGKKHLIMPFIFLFMLESCVNINSSSQIEPVDSISSESIANIVDGFSSNSISNSEVAYPDYVYNLHTLEYSSFEFNDEIEEILVDNKEIELEFIDLDRQQLVFRQDLMFDISYGKHNILINKFVSFNLLIVDDRLPTNLDGEKYNYNDDDIFIAFDFFGYDFTLSGCGIQEKDYVIRENGIILLYDFVEFLSYGNNKFLYSISYIDSYALEEKIIEGTFIIYKRDFGGIIWQ